MTRGHESADGRFDAGVIITIVIAVVWWGSAPVGIRAALGGYRPAHLSLFRFGIASVLLAIYAAFAGVRMPERRDWLWLTLTGAIGITFYNIILNYGLQTVPAATGSFVISTTPIWTALLAVITLGERLTLWGWAGILISFAGIALISRERRSDHSCGGDFLRRLLGPAEAVARAIHAVRGHVLRVLGGNPADGSIRARLAGGDPGGPARRDLVGCVSGNLSGGARKLGLGLRDVARRSGASEQLPVPDAGRHGRDWMGVVRRGADCARVDRRADRAGRSGDHASMGPCPSAAGNAGCQVRVPFWAATARLYC
jgi:uncharacterized membrane protein